jgi:hypothetical protein
VTVKHVLVALIILLEIIVAIYLYSSTSGGQTPAPFAIPTSATTTSSASTVTKTSTTTTHPPVDQIKVESAVIINDTLRMEVHNLGPSTTSLLTLASVCNPGFQTCHSYASLAGAYYKQTFVLPANRTFMANLTRVCAVPISSCRSYLPVANNTYYLQVKFGFVDGTSVLVPVTAMANDTWSPYITAIEDITSPSLVVAPPNLTGLLNITVMVNDSLPSASWTTLLDGYQKSSGAYSGTLLTNSTGCMGSGTGNFTSDGHKLVANFTGDCSQPLRVIVSFSTVLTGVVPGSYYALVVRDTTDIDKPAGYPNNDPGSFTTFVVWVQCTQSQTMTLTNSTA